MPRTPATAHSMCGHSADGAEWTNNTPWVVPIDPPRPRQREGCLPQHPHGRASADLLFHCASIVPTAPPRLRKRRARTAPSTVAGMTVAPFGSWSSPITAASLTSESVGLAAPALLAGDL